MSNAPAASRPSFSFKVQMGLVDITLSAYSLLDSKTVQRRMFTTSGNPVGVQNFDKETGAILFADDIVKKFELPDGSWVELSDAEIEAALSDSGTEVLAVAPVSSIDMEYFEFYVVRPGKDSNKPAQLLLQALNDLERAMLIRIVNRGRERLGVLFGDGYLSIGPWRDEIRQPPKPAVPVTLSQAEREMAAVILNSMPTVPDGELDSILYGKVVEYAQAKNDGLAQQAEQPSVSPSADLMELLKASVEAAKK